jgi:putative heme iron utilization protein
MISSSRQHAAPPGPVRPAAPEPPLAERARTLMHLGRIGSLATHSRRRPGFPFGSVMPYASDERGRPVFFISSMAMHTQNLKADARASLLVAQTEGGDPLGAARATLMGEVVPVPEPELGQVRELYLARYESARHWVDFDDFRLFRMKPAEVYFIGGFGVMGWIPGEEYARAEPDPLAESAAGILRHMNEDHPEALLRLARAAGASDVESAAMTAIDRLGFHLRLRSGTRVFGVRIGFPREARSGSEVRTVLDEMVHNAGAAG